MTRAGGGGLHWRALRKSQGSARTNYILLAHFAALLVPVCLFLQRHTDWHTLCPLLWADEQNLKIGRRP